MKSFRWVLLLLLSAMVGANAWSQGTLRAITSLADQGSGTLREAVALANPGDTLRFQVAGTLALATEIRLDTHLVVEGFGPGITVLDGVNTHRIFRIGENDTVVLSGLTLSHGFVSTTQEEGGGAIKNLGFLTAHNCLFADNRAVYGGAIENVSYGGRNSRLELYRCTFLRNSTYFVSFDYTSSGGALYADARLAGTSFIVAENCTFYENNAAISGGAFFLIDKTQGLASLTLRYCTVVNNHAGKRCGGIDIAEADSVNMLGNLVYGNTGDYIRPEIFGQVVSFGHNLIGDTSSTRMFPAFGDLIGIAPGLSPLEEPLGFAPTLPLSCNSPAVQAGDAGNFPLQDGRGQTRVGLPDIGAHERLPIDLAVTNLLGAGKGSLRQAVINTCGGDTLNLGGLSGTISFSEPVVLDHDLVILGNPNSSLIFSGSDTSRLFEIESGVNAAFDWLTFSDANPAYFGGGAILNKGKLSVENSTFVANKALAGGALAIYGDGDTATFFARNVTFSQNRAVGLSGGALDIRSYDYPAFVTLDHCTFSENTAYSQGGAISREGTGNLLLSNTLIALNQAPLAPDGFGLGASGGHNLLSDSTDAHWQPASGDLLAPNPLLDTYGAYGGPTGTYRLLAGSPAVDAGAATSSLLTDQRGFPRIFNGVSDIGAYEFDPQTNLSPEFSGPSIRVFPNPNTGALYVTGVKERAAYRILDIRGAACLQGILMDAYPVPIDHLPAGIYLLQVWVGDHFQAVRFSKI